MLQRTFALASLVLIGSITCLQADDDLANIDEKATHVDSSTIKIPKINAFCLNKQGQILAACGAGPGEIRVFDSEGTEIRSWEVEIKPEAINTTKNGDVLVAGVGKLMHFNIEGKLLNSAPSPHAEAMRGDSDKLRTAAIAQLSQSDVNYQASVDVYKQIIKQLEEKKENDTITQQEERMLTSLPQALKKLEELLAEQEKQREEQKEPSEEKIQQLIDNMLRSKMRVASISTDGENTYIATQAAVGYGYDVWKMEIDFSGGEQIVTGLRGCCGQMDVQCCESGIYVAENSRHRVICYDKNGEEKCQWGQRDRAGIDGFTSCCNPMNVCFNARGDVFTAESNTGRIKQFTADGEFLAFVGDVKLVPGCKNVSIAVSPEGERVYMLDITRGHIVVMKEKPEASVAASPDA